MYQNETPWTNQSWYNALWSEPKFIAVPKHKKVAKFNQVMLTKIRLPAKIPCHMHSLRLVSC